MGLFYKKSYSKVLIMFFIVLFFIPAVYSREDIHTEKKTGKKIKKKLKLKKDSPAYDFKFTLQGGQVINYMNYSITSPLIGAGFDFSGDFGRFGYFEPSVGYSIHAEKFFLNAEKSENTLDTVEQKLDLKIDYKNRPVKISVDLNYDWVLRPGWPDLYQPDPLTYNSSYNLDNINYPATDRYSYHKINPELGFQYRIRPRYPIDVKAGYIKMIGYADPNYDSAKPTHLAPDLYSKIYGEVGIRRHSRKYLINFSIKNRYSMLTHEEELARDRVSGLTHYSTTPNPLYEETHNETDVSVTFNIAAVKLKITPLYAYHINTDEFQGYYSYTEHEFGIKLRQSLLGGNLRYRIKAVRKLRTYTSDGYGVATGHFPLTDGDTLYKNYWVINSKIDFKIDENISVFAGFNMKIKETNYPSYVPGVNPTGDTANPGTKNYDIDFSFINYRFDIGVSYTI